MGVMEMFYILIMVVIQLFVKSHITVHQKGLILFYVNVVSINLILEKIAADKVWEGQI